MGGPNEAVHATEVVPAAYLRRSRERRLALLTAAEAVFRARFGVSSDGEAVGSDRGMALALQALQALTKSGVSANALCCNSALAMIGIGAVLAAHMAANPSTQLLVTL